MGFFYLYFFSSLFLSVSFPYCLQSTTYFERRESMTTGYEFGKTYTISHQIMFIDQVFSSYWLENPGKKYNSEVLVFLKLRNGLKKPTNQPNPKQLILYLKLWERVLFSISTNCTISQMHCSCGSWKLVS